MPKIKQTPITDYMVVDKTYLRDFNLGLMERGLLSTMISLPDNYDFSGRALSELIPNGRDSVFASLNKLEKAGYLRRRKLYRNGRVFDVEYQIAQQPIFSEEKIEENLNQKTTEKMQKNAENKKMASFCGENEEIATFQNANKPNKIKGSEEKVASFFEEKLIPEKLDPDFQDLVNSPQIKENIKDNILSNNTTISILVCNKEKDIKRYSVASSQKTELSQNDRIESAATRYMAASLDASAPDCSNEAGNRSVNPFSPQTYEESMNRDVEFPAPLSTYSEPRAIDLQRMRDRGELVTYIKERIMCYEFCRTRLNVRARDLDMVLRALTELLTSNRILIRGKRIGIREIRERLCELDGEKVAFVIANYNKRKSELARRDMYLKAALLYAQDPIVLAAKKHPAF